MLQLDAGLVEIRDVLDAEDSLVSAQDALTRALVGYRVAELEKAADSVETAQELLPDVVDTEKLPDQPA